MKEGKIEILKWLQVAIDLIEKDDFDAAWRALQKASDGCSDEARRLFNDAFTKAE